MKGIGNKILLIIVVMLGLYFYRITLIVVGILFFLIIVAFLNRRKEEKTKKEFREENNGKYFIWYSSNKRIKEIIENKLMPIIDVEYEVIYNNREKIRSNLSDEELNYIRKETSSIKFPIVVKVGKDRIYAETFFDEMYLCRNTKIGDEELEKKIMLKLNKLKNEQTKHKRRRP